MRSLSRKTSSLATASTLPLASRYTLTRTRPSAATSQDCRGTVPGSRESSPGRLISPTVDGDEPHRRAADAPPRHHLLDRRPRRGGDCLLYTSDAADDLLCVDLGGR